MYPHWRALLPHLTSVQKITLGTFSYGFLRAIRADYPESESLLGNRVANGMCYGMIHLFSPYTVYQMGHLLNRMDIALTGKNPNDYPHSYVIGDTKGMNPRVFF